MIEPCGHPISHAFQLKDHGCIVNHTLKRRKKSYKD